MDGLQIAAVVVSLLLLYVVLDLVRRKKLAEEYSFVWIACALVLLAASFARHTLDRVALSIGIAYPPAALLLVLVLFVFLASVSFSVVISRQRQQIERLVEDVALLEARLREVEDVRSENVGSSHVGSDLALKGRDNRRRHDLSTQDLTPPA